MARASDSTRWCSRLEMEALRNWLRCAHVHVSKETYFGRAKEAYHMAKEACSMAKEAYSMAKEAY